MTDNLTTLTIRWNPWGPEDIAGQLYDGSVMLWGHVSSSKSWLEADLLRNFGRAALLVERYPNGFRIKWEAAAT